MVRLLLYLLIGREQVIKLRKILALSERDVFNYYENVWGSRIFNLPHDDIINFAKQNGRLAEINEVTSINVGHKYR